jgi:2-succinyl-5-enolpyruvyl-6-hydroxy-3-cyclohexene-1-carboxylate synthase
MGEIRSESMWLTAFRAMHATVQASLDEAISSDELTEPWISRHLFDDLPDDARIVVSSSMPIRDVESFSRPQRSSHVLYSNRGASGIDGVVSTALGVALGSARPTVCLIGDLAFLHDIGAFVDVDDSQSTSPCVFVVLDNGGGGIFQFLPQHEVLPKAAFETLFGTQSRQNIRDVVGGFGVPCEEVHTTAELMSTLEKFLQGDQRAVIVAKVPSRDENVVIHEKISFLVARALTGSRTDTKEQ